MREVIIVLIVACVLIFCFLLLRQYLSKSKTIRCFHEDVQIFKMTDALDVKIIMNAILKSGFEFMKYDSIKKRFSVETKLSRWSWGERITITMITSNDEIAIQIYSISKLRIQIIDFGKNKRNVQVFFRHLKSEIYQFPIEN